MAERTLRATTYGREPTRVTAQLIEYGTGARWRRAAGIGLPLLAAALVSLFVPAWHFVGVPGFLIASVVFSLRRLRERFSVDSLQGDCPACGQVQTFPTEGGLRLPANLRCPACREFVKIDAPG